MPKSIRPHHTISFALLVLVLCLPAALRAQTNGTSPAIVTASLEACIEQALANNHRRPASQFAVQMAEAQHRQALAGYWPQISGTLAYQRLDESPNFIFPSRTFQTGATSISLPTGTSLTLTTPMGDMPLTSIDVPAQQVEVPAQDVTLMDEDSYTASLNAQWLLYDGGMRKGYREQSAAQVAMMQQEARRTDMEIVDAVKRLYWGAVLARQLADLGQITLERMEATLLLTETMYREGSGRVKKTDWLDNKIMVESIRAMVALLNKNRLMSQAALANTMGLSWNASVAPADFDIPYVPFRADLTALVGTAYEFNPDWNKIEQGLRAAEGMERTAKSGHMPKVALTGELHKWWNGYDAGLVTDINKDGWSVGVGMEIPLFDGFLTTGKVQEARARIAQIREQKILLKEGLGLQIKDTFLALGAADTSYAATREAMDAAVENCDLNTRAYQMELVETEKVIRAQLMEALMSAQHYKASYDHAALQSQLQLVVGGEIAKLLGVQ